MESILAILILVLYETFASVSAPTMDVVVDTSRFCIMPAHQKMNGAEVADVSKLTVLLQFA